VSRRSSPVRSGVLTVAAGLLAVAALAGCSSDSTDTTTDTTAPATESPSTDVCADLDAAKASLQALVDTNVVQEGTDTVKERFAAVEADVQALLESGRSEVAAETAAVKDSIAELGDVLAGLAEGAPAADLALIKPSLLAVQASLQELFTALEDTC
jgi:hypothetical protein